MQVSPLEYFSAKSMGAARYLLRPVEQSLPPLLPGARVLDVGCGNGLWAGWLVARGYDVLGIDPSPSGIALARQAHPAARFAQIAVSERLLDLLQVAPFDLVISLEVVEHLYSPRQWAEACFNALRPGGRLICSAPYHGYWKNLAISLTNRWGKHFNPLYEGGHIKLWSPGTLSQLLRLEGFQVKSFLGAGRFIGFWKSMVLSANRPR